MFVSGVFLSLLLFPHVGVTSFGASIFLFFDAMAHVGATLGDMRYGESAHCIGAKRSVVVLGLDF